MGVLLGLGLLISALGLALGGKRVNAGWSIDKDCYTAKLVDNRKALESTMRFMEENGIVGEVRDLDDVHARLAFYFSWLFDACVNPPEFIEDPAVGKLPWDEWVQQAVGIVEGTAMMTRVGFLAQRLAKGR